MADARVAVVTGAASGIGAATARRLAASGYRVWLTDLNIDACVQIADEIGDGDGRAASVAVDVSDAVAVQAAFATITKQDPALDVLVNCVGIITVRAFADWSQDEWERIYRVNTIGTYLCIQAALPALRSGRLPSRIVNVASTAAKTSSTLVTPYAAAKAAVIALTRSAAAALAPDVLVNCICPGIVATPMWADIDSGFVDFGSGKTMEDWTSTLPIKRAATPAEIANTIAFLVSEEAGYIVGEDINVDGGLTTR